jgi:hypothetical protein
VIINVTAGGDKRAWKAEGGKQKAEGRKQKAVRTLDVS